MIDTNTNDDNLRLAAALLTESMKWVKQAHERMTKATHVPVKLQNRLNKIFKKAQRQQLELYGLYSRKTWRTTKPPKIVTENIKGGGSITYQKV